MRLHQLISNSILALTTLSVFTAAANEPPAIGISRDNTGALQLSLVGTAGERYAIERSSAPALNTWTVVDVFSATGPVSSPVAGAAEDFGIFRARVLDPSLFANQVLNFTLLDQNGRAFELAYFDHDPAIKALVLIFASTTSPAFKSIAPALKQLQNEFGSEGILFWVIDPEPGRTREQLAATASGLGLGLPLLLDRGQAVARSYWAIQSLETIVIDREKWEVCFRGPFESPSGGARQALESLLSGERPDEIWIAPDPSPSLAIQSKRAISYADQIAPLLQHKCVTCHSPDNIAPWAMTNHAIVQAYAPAIQNEVLAGRMPPWHADPVHNSFANDFSLTPDEKSILLQWIADGAPRGAGPDPLLELPQPPAPWPPELGEPDTVLTIPVQQIPATGTLPYRYIPVETSFPEDVWLKAAIVVPSNRRVVHHYAIWEGLSTAAQIDRYLASYVPGQKPLAFPDGTGWLLRKGQPITFNLHYTATGQEEEDQPTLYLWLHDTPPAARIQNRAVANIFFTIPPHAQEHQTEAEFRFDKAVRIYDLAPHMHVRGKWMKFEAVYPDGSRELLLSVPKYEFHWQHLYRFAEPKVLPANTRLKVTGAFDNSAQNHENPDPNQTVFWGLQSWDEMFIGYVNYAEIE